MPKRGRGTAIQRTASILLEADEAGRDALCALQAAYAHACNLLVPIVIKHRCWNRFRLHTLAYRLLREETLLGSQMCCNALRTVTAAYKAMRSNGEIEKSEPIPAINFRRASVHFDKRTFSMRDDQLSLYTLTGRIIVTLKPGKHQKRLLAWGKPKEAELVFRKGRLFFNLVLEKEIDFCTFGPVLGLDVGENNLAAVSTGKVWGGGKLRHQRDCYLALRGRVQSNGSKSAKQLLQKVSGKEQRHMRHVNHLTSKEIVTQAVAIGARAIAVEDLTHIRSRIKAGRRMRSRLHRWAFRQLQDFVAYKAAEFGIETIFVDSAYTSKTCSECGQIGLRVKHRFTCDCGCRAHSDVNASSNLARLGESALSLRAAVNRPNVAEIGHAILRQ